MDLPKTQMHPEILPRNAQRMSWSRYLVIVGLFLLKYSILFYSPKNSTRLHCAQTIKDKYPSLYQTLNLSKLRKEHLKHHLISVASPSRLRVKIPTISAIPVK